MSYRDDLAEFLYVEENWHREIIEHDFDRLSDDVYKARAVKRWRDGKPGWSYERKYPALADMIIAHDAAHGIHRLVIDDATVERAAKGLRDSMVGASAMTLQWEQLADEYREGYRTRARSVLAAAVEADQ